jgi:stage II sporulation protein R
VNYGLNYFPKKEYKGVIYNEGYYESLVIKIGKGEGNNFWCVMFPPLCFLEAEKSEKIEYKFFVKEIIDKILKNN